MNRETKLKLIPPIMYAVASAVLFVMSWPGEPKVRHVVGVSLTGIAFVLWLTARIQLGNAFSIGAKASYLVTSGLYSKLRHPVYYFSILAMVGLGLYIWTPWVFIPIVLLVLLEIYRIQREEAVLLKTFGAKYKTYKTNTWF